MKRRCDAWLTTTNGNDRTPKGILSLGGVLVVCVRDRWDCHPRTLCERAPSVRDPEVTRRFPWRDACAGSGKGALRTVVGEQDGG